jgi:lipopolysaccharide transport system permease protein
MTVTEIAARSSLPATVAAPPAVAASAKPSVWGLIWTLVRTDFKSRYHGTLSGFAWALLKPLMMFVVLQTVFSVIFASDRNYRLNLVIGLFLWDFFAETTRTGMTVLHAKGFLLTKAKFPPWILVLTSLSNPLITIGAFAIVIAIFLIGSGHAPTAAAVALFVVYIAGLAVVSLGIGLATSALFLRYRDLNQVWDVIIQAGFFVAPIVYPLGILPERYHIYLYLWPPTPFIQFSRAVLVDGVVPGLRAHIVLAAGAGVILASGILMFRRFSPRAAEYL